MLPSLTASPSCPPSPPHPLITLQLILEGMIVLPNHLSIPVLPNFGVAPLPKGALNIKLLR